MLKQSTDRHHRRFHFNFDLEDSAPASRPTDRRRNERFDFSEPLTVLQADKRTPFGAAINVCADGLSINTDTELQGEQRLSLWLEFLGAAGQHRFVSITCVTKWSWYDEQAQHYRLGCCFLDIDTEALAEIMALARDAQAANVVQAA